MALYLSPFNRIKHVAILMLGIALLTSWLAAAAAPWQIQFAPKSDVDWVTLVGGKSDAVIVVDVNDYPVVQLAAALFADDVQRISGRRPLVKDNSARAPQMVIVGTLGHSALVEQLAAAGKLKDLDKIKGRWETTLSQVVKQPLPGVERALVIVGSDRRGAAYGLMQLSEKIGVSPWYWWADVPAQHHDALALKISAPQVDAPGVKYRGIFINDEDWGINPWAAKTFDPEFKNIGPKTYERVFELMLRLRLNYLWPAMHPCSTEFGSVPENIVLADKFAIVAGSSHCEPMLCNNVHWNEKAKGRWNYRLNRDAIRSYWGDNAKAHGADEAVWTLGIRGIHDQGMQTPPTDMPGKLSLMTEVFRDQRALLDQSVTKQWGPVAQCFVPYKEVLPIYDAGLSVPEDVTLVWVDDNFGYIRRLSNPEERKRPGGAGVYWHLSYYGSPHSYTWINTTPPALMWEELHKAWENDARSLWVINVGDLKPMEIGIDYFSRLAWNPEGFDLGAQRAFLCDFELHIFGAPAVQPLTDMLMEFYRLGTIRKPELMNRAWALSLPPEQARQLEDNYKNLLAREAAIFGTIPAEVRDAYTEMIGFPARVLGSAGLIFMADRKIQFDVDTAANESAITRRRNDLEAQADNYNTKIAGGKWNHMMPGLVTGNDLTKWSSQVRWPWGEKPSQPGQPATDPAFLNESPVGQGWRDAATADRKLSPGAAHWSVIEGLGQSGRAMALQPASLEASWKDGDKSAPTLEYEFTTKGGIAEAFVDVLPAFRIYPGMKLRFAVSVDDLAPTFMEVPGANGAENENGAVRSFAVQNNYVRVRVPLPALTAGTHTFKIRSVDPGAVIDRVSLPRE